MTIATELMTSATWTWRQTAARRETGSRNASPRAHDRAKGGAPPLDQAFFDACAAQASAILAHVDDAAQARYAIERIDAIFDAVGVDAQRLLSTGQRGPLPVGAGTQD